MSRDKLQELEDALSAMYGSAARCRQELLELEKAEAAVEERYRQTVAESAALMERLKSAHPVIRERGRRLAALLRKEAPDEQRRERMHQRLHSELEAIQKSPLWDYELQRLRRPRKRAAGVRPGRDIVRVFYEIDGMRFLAEGKLLYHVLEGRADQRYRTWRGAPDLEWFPETRADAGEVRFLIFEPVALEQPAALRYDRIVEATPRGDAPDMAEEALTLPHPRISGRVRRAGQSWMKVRL